jgi:histidine triad (HIT) family protein
VLSESDNYNIEDCLFCKIVKGNIPCDKVFEDEEVFAFKDIDPKAPEHILIIPKKHIDRISSLEDKDKDLIGSMILAANRIAGERGLNKKGFRIVINCGEAAGQEVFHVHMHLLGGRHFSWPPG